MPRPPKCRRVEFMPVNTLFIPAQVPSEKEVTLTFEELEAIRLKDVEDLEQEACAERMRVSRPTFQRILESARAKIGEALVFGKRIRIEGGTYQVAMRKFACRSCAAEFEVPFGNGPRGIDMRCPVCGLQTVHRIDQNGHGFGNQPWGRNDKSTE